MKAVKVRLLPVGQADCILIQFPDNSWAVIDCGSTARDTATFMALEQLQKEPRDMPVRFVLATHPDADHCLGIPGFLRLCVGMRKVEAFYHCGVRRKIQKGRSRKLLSAVHCAEELQQRGQIGIVKALRAGDRISWDQPVDSLSISVLNPAAGTVPSAAVRAGEANDVSVVLSIAYHGVNLLMAGDIGKDAWGRVVTESDFQQPNILKVPHHGARNGIPPIEVFGSANSTNWALLSTDSGVEDKPHADTLDHYWARAMWKTRCTGLSPHCSAENGEKYPVPADSRKYPEDLRQTLQLSARHAMHLEHGTLLGCCVNNEITIMEDGTITHSVRSKGCDARA